MTTKQSHTDANEELNFSNCRCSAYHTCEWCCRNASALLSDAQTNGGNCDV